MLTCFSQEAKGIPIEFVTAADYPRWINQQSAIMTNWLKQNRFQAENGHSILIPDSQGCIDRLICCVNNKNDIFNLGNLPLTLPEGFYLLADEDAIGAAALGWGLGAYQFTRYKTAARKPAQLYLPASVAREIHALLESIYLVRNLINTPTDDMGPSEFAAEVELVTKPFAATVNQIIGDALKAKNYHAIYTVGRASDDPPRLIDFRWGDKDKPKVTLVGKGVCFDSGGLDLKPSQYMSLMKKDMAGAAHVLGLAHMIMAMNLPISLRVLMPCVENVISGNAYRPGDIIKSRKGLSIEVGNTDAEGRVILADALTEAVSEKPDLLIDLTTLTGAARVALGTDLPAIFSNNDKLMKEVVLQGEKTQDQLWPMPLFSLYREFNNSPIADINNCSSEPYAGAITAALFLQAFVPDEIPWLHIDMMAWNLRPRPGRPQGGEAMTLRALYAYLKERYH